MKKVLLTIKQIEIFNKYQTIKKELQDKFAVVTEMENDFVTSVFESAGEEIVEGIQFDGQSFVLPETKEDAPAKVTKKLKAKN